MVHALLVLWVELGSVVALVIVRDHNSFAALRGRGLKLDSVRQKVNILVVLKRFLGLRLGDLRRLVVLVQEDLGSHLLELLVHQHSDMLRGKLLPLVIDRVYRRYELGRARELVRHKLLPGSLLANLPQLYLEVPHTDTLLRGVDGVIAFLVWKGKFHRLSEPLEF